MGSTPIPGSTGLIRIASPIKEKIWRTLWSMKKDGYSEATIYAMNRRLRMIAHDTGMSPIELQRMRLRWIDFKRGIINVQTAKGGVGRSLKLKPQTLAMLKEYVSIRQFSLNDKLLVR